MIEGTDRPSAMAPTELQSLRDRVYSLEKRCQSFEATALMLFQDLVAQVQMREPPLSPLLTPQAIVQSLQAQHPELADHGSLWINLEQVLQRDREMLQTETRQAVWQSAIGLRQQMETLLQRL